MEWQITTLSKAVDKELDALPKDLQAKFLHIAELLQDFGPQQLGEPYIKPIKVKNANLWEMRMRGKSGIARAIYVTASKRTQLIILHAFVKKTQKTPKHAINLALKRLKEVEL